MYDYQFHLELCDDDDDKDGNVNSCSAISKTYPKCGARKDCSKAVSEFEHAFTITPDMEDHRFITVELKLTEEKHFAEKKKRDFHFRMRMSFAPTDETVRSENFFVSTDSCPKIVTTTSLPIEETTLSVSPTFRDTSLTSIYYGMIILVTDLVVLIVFLGYYRILTKHKRTQNPSQSRIDFPSPESKSQTEIFNNVNVNVNETVKSIESYTLLSEERLPDK